MHRLRCSGIFDLWGLEHYTLISSSNSVSNTPKPFCEDKETLGALGFMLCHKELEGLTQQNVCG